MNWLKRAVVWLSRLRHCGGFGIQSPWAYQMARNVINEHWPYYAYDDLADAANGSDKDAIRLCRLYFRLANFLQPSIVVDYRPESDDYARYMKRGCMKSDIRKITSNDDLQALSHIDLMRMSLAGDYKDVFFASLRKVTASSVIILQDIYSNQSTKAFWRNVLADERCRTTFDLYYCGLVFFDPKRYKENYIINF